MNYSTAVFLINKNLRAVQAIYEPEGGKPSIFKTFDKTVKVDDLVIVPTGTRVKMTVCKITAVDVPVDFDSVADVKWIVGKVDSRDYEKTLVEEAAAIDAIKSAEFNKRRKEMCAALLDDEAGKIKALTLNTTCVAPEPQA